MSELSGSRAQTKEQKHKLFEYVAVVALEQITEKGQIHYVARARFRYPPPAAGTSDAHFSSITQFCFPDIDAITPTKEMQRYSFRSSSKKKR